MASCWIVSRMCWIHQVWCRLNAKTLSSSSSRLVYSFYGKAILYNAFTLVLVFRRRVFEDFRVEADWFRHHHGLSHSEGSSNHQDCVIKECKGTGGINVLLGSHGVLYCNRVCIAWEDAIQRVWREFLYVLPESVQIVALFYQFIVTVFNLFSRYDHSVAHLVLREEILFQVVWTRICVGCDGADIVTDASFLLNLHFVCCSFGLLGYLLSGGFDGIVTPERLTILRRR